MNTLKRYRYLIARRIVQLSLLIVFSGGNYWGWTILKGNYSAALVFDTIPLTDPYAVLQMLFSGFMASLDILLGAVIILLVYAIFTGRMFCSWVCPMNIISDSANYARKKLGFTEVLSFTRKARYYVLVLGLILSAILGFSAFEAISPISLLHRGIIFGMGSGWAIILAIFLFDLSITKDGWCGHLCPLGAFYAVTGHYSVLKVKHNKDNCTNCMKCFSVCHEVQVLDIIGKKTGFIDSSQCTNCLRCIEVCDDNALKLSLRKPSKRVAN